jgi:hypothetical protein
VSEGKNETLANENEKKRKKIKEEIAHLYSSM